MSPNRLAVLWKYTHRQNAIPPDMRSRYRNLDWYEIADHVEWLSRDGYMTLPNYLLTTKGEAALRPGNRVRVVTRRKPCGR